MAYNEWVGYNSYSASDNNVGGAFSLSSLSFSAVIDNDSGQNSVSGSFDLTPLSFSCIIDNTTATENDVSSSFSLSSLSFNGRIQNGDLTPIFSTLTNVTQVYKSTNINQT